MTEREHEELREQAALFVLGALTPAERIAFESHLAGCAECASDVRSLGGITMLLAQAAPQVEPPAALRQRVLQSVAGAATARPERVRPRAASTAVPWLAVAASAILTLVLAGYTARLRARIDDLELRLRGALARADASDRMVADARRAVADADTRLAVLAAPDVARVDMAGQPVSPQATGRGFWSRSRGLVFTATNLPALPPGRTYQLWVLTARTAPISNGWLFRPDANGSASAIFQTPIDLPRPTAMAVTIEPDGGVQAPTGDKYLVGVAPTS